MRLLGQAFAAVLLLGVVLFASMGAYARFLYHPFGPPRPFDHTFFALVVFGPAAGLVIAFLMYCVLRHRRTESALRAREDGRCP